MKKRLATKTRNNILIVFFVSVIFSKPDGGGSTVPVVHQTPGQGQHSDINTPWKVLVPENNSPANLPGGQLMLNTDPVLPNSHDDYARQSNFQALNKGSSTNQNIGDRNQGTTAGQTSNGQILTNDRIIDSQPYTETQKAQILQQEQEQHLMNIPTRTISRNKVGYDPRTSPLSQDSRNRQDDLTSQYRPSVSRTVTKSQVGSQNQNTEQQKSIGNKVDTVPKTMNNVSPNQRPNAGSKTAGRLVKISENDLVEQQRFSQLGTTLQGHSSGSPESATSLQVDQPTGMNLFPNQPLSLNEKKITKFQEDASLHGSRPFAENIQSTGIPGKVRNNTQSDSNPLVVADQKPYPIHGALVNNNNFHVAPNYNEQMPSRSHDTSANTENRNLNIVNNVKTTGPLVASPNTANKKPYSSPSETKAKPANKLPYSPQYLHPADGHVHPELLNDQHPVHVPATSHNVHLPVPANNPWPMMPTGGLRILVPDLMTGKFRWQKVGFGGMLYGDRYFSSLLCSSVLIISMRSFYSHNICHVYLIKLFNLFGNFH